jgi:hypothetical protein
MTRQEDIWNCEECSEAYGRHDLWFEGICEKCNAEKNVQLFKVMVSAEGFAEIHTEWLTLEEADELRLDLANTFPDNDYWIQHHTDEDWDEKYKRERSYNDNAVDGWEDMFPHDEDFI